MVRVVNCTVCGLDYAHLIGQDFEVLSEDVNGEFVRITDGMGNVHTVSGCDIEEVEENG